MAIVSFILQIVALVCLLLAALNVRSPPPIAWGWLGLFLWLLSLMTSGVVLHPAHY